MSTANGDTRREKLLAALALARAQPRKARTKTGKPCLVCDQLASYNDCGEKCREYKDRLIAACNLCRNPEVGEVGQ